MSERRITDRNQARAFARSIKHLAYTTEEAISREDWNDAADQLSLARDDAADLAAFLAQQRKQPTKTQCDQLVTKGWICDQVRGHDGPCTNAHLPSAWRKEKQR